MPAVKDHSLVVAAAGALLPPGARLARRHGPMGPSLSLVHVGSLQRGWGYPILRAVGAGAFRLTPEEGVTITAPEIPAPCGRFAFGQCALRALVGRNGGMSRAAKGADC